MLSTVVGHKLDGEGRDGRSIEGVCSTQEADMTSCSRRPTSNESSEFSRGGLRLMMLAVPSSASLSSFRNTPQNGTTWQCGELNQSVQNRPTATPGVLPTEEPTLHPGILRALVTTFLYSEEDSCWAMASFRLRMVSMSD